MTWLLSLVAVMMDIAELNYTTWRGIERLAGEIFTKARSNMQLGENFTKVTSLLRELWKLTILENGDSMSAIYESSRD